MYDSFLKTKSDTTDLIVAIDDNDESFERYNLVGCKFCVLPRQDVIKIHNKIATENIYDYYMPINDDFVFETDKWDEKLIKVVEDNGGWGVAFADDKIHSGRIDLPTVAIVPGKLVRTLGFLFPNSLHGLCGDCFLADIAKAIGQFQYVPEVVVNHKHWSAGKSQMDSTYAYQEQRHGQDKELYQDYKNTRLSADIKRVKDEMFGIN